eukprot:TRINITY_DN15044_c0_g1_i5.p1 TRINITY_DN15044_c0_g1~~TRINITY_DN15044_c0_g1_i5.p1  ORF type:complete len:379 (-),score=111.07 TRINITY_DN15044_c0_g1_i5:68-1204(-)
MMEDDSAFRNPESSSPKFWGKCWFITLAVVAWILGLGALAAAGYCGINGKLASDDYRNIRKEDRKVLEELKQAEAEALKLAAEVDKVKQEVVRDEGEAKQKSEEFKRLDEIYKKVSAEYMDYVKKLNKVLDEILVFQKENKELEVKNNETARKVEELTKEIEVLKQGIETCTEERRVYMISSGINAAGLTFFVANLFYEYLQIEELARKVNEYGYYLKSFAHVAEGLVNYELLKRSTKKNVHRTNCFNGTNKHGLEACNAKKPTITTIHAKGGYRFGAVLFAPWSTSKGDHADKDAFTFSGYVGEITTIVEKEKAMIVSDSTLLEFGDGDIHIPLHGNGTVFEKSYMLPPHFSHYNFYIDGTQFSIERIEVDELSGFT